jgi:hypothetical protein
MPRNEKTGPKVARTASQILRDPAATPRAKSVAGSALSQAAAGKTTSARVATQAANALDDGRSGKGTRQVSSSVLTQKTRR